MEELQPKPLCAQKYELCVLQREELCFLGQRLEGSNGMKTSPSSATKLPRNRRLTIHPGFN